MSSETKWTKGPWAASDDTVVSEGGVWVKPYGFDSWEGNRKWPSRGEQRANAHLIAAAPELYECLAHVANVIELANNGHPVPENHDGEQWLERTLAALAKARGES